MTAHVISAHNVQYTIHTEEGSKIGQHISETGQPYEPWLLEEIWGRGYKGVAVDVGAHIGNHTLWFALVCKLDVVAFEPIFEEELTRNIQINSGSPDAYRIELHNVALGAKDGRADDLQMRVLTEPGADRGPGTAEGKLYLSPEGDIPVRTLDSYELEDVAFIKIDVEGMEPDVLRGGAVTIAESRPTIYAESPDEASHKRLGAVLTPMSYRKTGRFKRGTPIEIWEAQ